MKKMTRVHQILHSKYGNNDCTGNYRAWEYHTDYEIEFFYGSTSKLTANIIAEKMLSQVDSEGRHFQLLK